MRKQDKTKQVAQIAKRMGVLRPRDLDAHGISRTYLRRAYELGLIRRVGRGLYIPEDAQASEHHTLAEACKIVPKGTVCLVSALRFHDLTTQAPFEVWMAIGEKAWRSKVRYPRMRFVRFSGDALIKGVEERRVEGVPIRVYDPAKTVADCFKYRNKIGLDVAIEGLRDCLRKRKCTIDQLWHYGRICRVTNIIKPYLEAIT